MGASTDDKLANKDLVARLKKKLVAERKRRAKFEQQLKTGAGNRMVQAAIRMNNAATTMTKDLKLFLTLSKRHEKYVQEKRLMPSKFKMVNSGSGAVAGRNRPRMGRHLRPLT